MKKFALAAQMIEKRISYADHVVTGIPSERQLAEDLGLSRNTVRKAVQQLIDEGTLIRLENGRLEIATPSGKERTRTIGFIAPAGVSTNRDQWLESLISVVQGLPQQPVVARSVTYGHWADPVFQEALTSFDGAFFMTPTENVPSWLLTKITTSPCRVVSLDYDHSDAGLPSISLFPNSAQTKLFDHLYRLGHNRIDCLNTQSVDQVISGRIQAWREYLAINKLGGDLLSLEVRRPAESAYQLIRDCLHEGRSLASAIFCTTGPAAIGAMRALQEAGLKIGEDVSVCAVNSEGFGRLSLRSLTALEAPPRALYLRRACEWMLSTQPWQGPNLIQPEDVPLFEGESTGPALAKSIISSTPTWGSDGTNGLVVENKIADPEMAAFDLKVGTLT